MKKFINIFLTLIMISTIFCVPDVTKAKTLGDLKNELSQKQNEYNANEEQKQLTQEQINQTQSDITTIKKNMSQTYIDIANVQKEIDSLYNQISEKKAQVKQIINFDQISSGESSYLEYVFGAESFTDLIYRSAVSQQLANYNTTLVDEYNSLIEQSKQKQIDIQKKQVELADYQQELEKKVTSLGETLESQASTSLSVADEIKMQKEIIKVYEDKGCKDDENIKTCGVSTLPPGTAFYRPTMSGYIISEFGARDLLGMDWHEGVDVSVPEGTPVYSVANGEVYAIRIPYTYSYVSKDNCGGNMVVVHHNVNGKMYTTVYAHLLSYNVTAGQTVTTNTIIGYSGGSSTKSYDPCTTGAHLHLTVATGLYGVDYTNWTYQLNKVHAIGARTVINFPNGRNRWSDRVTAY